MLARGWDALSRLATVLSAAAALLSIGGCGEFATLSAPAWPPKENGGSEGDVTIFFWPSDEAIDGLS